MKLETERLILRPHTVEDFEDYFAYIMEPELRRMLGLNGVVDRESAQETFQWLLDNVEFIAMVRKESGKVIGHICIHPPIDKVADDLEFTGKKGASITFAIAKQEQRKGLMLEALQCLTARMFREGVDYIDCEYTPLNTASRGLQEKLGFHYWGAEQFGDEEIIINILQNPS